MSLVGFRAQNHPQQQAKAAVDDRGTSPEVFGPLQERFRFTLDVAASHTNAKLPRYYTAEDDGLTQPWGAGYLPPPDVLSERVWCNPPYSNIRPWVEKAWTECRGGAYPAPELIVMLLPANRTEQGWWQDLVEPYREPGGTLRVEFLRGRMRFIRPDAVIGPKGDRPPFGCCLLIWELK